MFVSFDVKIISKTQEMQIGQARGYKTVFMLNSVS